MSTGRAVRRSPLTLVLLAALLAAGCRRDMQDQPKLEAYEASPLFANGMASRPLPDGTVARGQLRESSRLYQGRDEAGELVTELPVELDRELLLRGRSRYEIYCSVCHDSAGTGRGMIVRRGFKQPPSMHEERLREVPIGHFYDVMTRGFGVMSSYAPQLPVADRWAVAAYLRALQLSQNQRVAAMPAEMRRELEHALEQQRAAADAHGGEGGHGAPAHGEDDHE